MNFEKITDSTNYKRAMDDYRFIGQAEFDPAVHPDRDPNERDADIDSFYDGWETICRGEDGNLYLVHFDWETKKPYIWARIQKEVLTENTKFLMHEYDYRETVGNIAYSWSETSNRPEPATLNDILRDLLHAMRDWYADYVISDPAEADDVDMRPGERYPLVIDAAAEYLLDRVDQANYRFNTIRGLAEDIFEIVEQSKTDA